MNPILAVLAEAINIAAAAFGKDLAQGVLEAMLRQRSIDDQLKQINAKLDAILSFLVNNLREVVDRSNDEQSAKEKYLEIVARAKTVSLEAARVRDLQNPTENDIGGLATLGKSCFEDAEILNTYGKQYYVGVVCSFMSALVAYQQVLRRDVSYSDTIKNRANSFLALFSDMVDQRVPGSFTSVLSMMQPAYTASLPHAPLVIGKNPNYAVSWQMIVDFDPDTLKETGRRVRIFSATVTRVGDSGWSMNGDNWVQEIGLNVGETTFDIFTDPRSQAEIAPWYTPAMRPWTWDLYHDFQAIIARHVRAYVEYGPKIPILVDAAASINDACKACKTIVSDNITEPEIQAKIAQTRNAFL